MKKFICLFVGCMIAFGITDVNAQDSHTSAPTKDARSISQVKVLFRKLMEVEDAHNLKALRAMMWNSSSMLFVSKKPKEEGYYGGYWGINVAMDHFTELYSHKFLLEPDYSQEKEVALAGDVIETYVPVKLTTVFISGKDAEPKAFILIMDWVKTTQGWKLATDVALPVPQDY